MIATNILPATGSVYPGEYIPLPETSALADDIRDVIARPESKVPLNLEEREDGVEIEMLMPGAKREDILIYTKGNILSVLVRTQCKLGNKATVHEFDSVCIERAIPLPVNADIEFLHAEYLYGTLRMYVPKSNHPLTPQPERTIPIY